MKLDELQLVIDMAERWHDRHAGGQSVTQAMTTALGHVRVETRTLIRKGRSEVS